MASHAHGGSLPSRQELKAISAAFSVDFAALFCADRLLDDACCGRKGPMTAWYC